MTDVKQTNTPNDFQTLNDGKRNSIHRLHLLKRMGLIRDQNELSFNIASSFPELKQAYSLCYRIFLENNYIEPNFIGMRLREWELNETTATFLAKSGHEIVGMISLVSEIEGYGLPSEWLFKEEISGIRKQARHMAESCNNAITAPFRFSSISFEFYRMMLAYAWMTGKDKVIAVINKSHKSFYEFLFMRQLGCEKSYSQWLYDPVILIYTDCHLLYDYLSSPASDNGSADSYLRDFLLLKNPYIPLIPRWKKKAQLAFRRHHISERFQDEIRNALMASAMPEIRGQKPSGKKQEPVYQHDE